MPNIKDNLQKTFLQAKATYAKHALVQKEMQQMLLDLLRKHQLTHFSQIIELGCGDGGLCFRALEDLSCGAYYAFDLIDYDMAFAKSKAYFVRLDIENLDLLCQYVCFGCHDLLLSNATLQWLPQRSYLPKLLARLKKDSILAFGIFGKAQYQEFREMFGLGLDYLCLAEYEAMLHGQFAIFELFSYQKTLYFENPLEVFRHCKLSGVNALGKNFVLTKAILLEYQRRFCNQLTYEPLFVLAKKIKE